jgi:carbon starvation protein
MSAGSFVPMVDGLQLVVALALMFLALMVVKHCGGELISSKVPAAKDAEQKA